MATIVLQVTGMKCGGCENAVQAAVRECSGVSAVKASHQAGTVEIEYDETQADIEAIRKTIKDKGYAVA